MSNSPEYQSGNSPERVFYPPFFGPVRHRRRGSVACTACRKRKIRCDVSFNDGCTNCLLDHEKCVVIRPTRAQHFRIQASTLNPLPEERHLAKQTANRIERIFSSRNYYEADVRAQFVPGSSSEKYGTNDPCMTDQQDIQQFNDRPFHAYFVEDSMPTPSVSDSGIETRRSQLCDTMINESSHLSSGSSNGEQTVSSPIASGPSTCGSFRDETRMHDVGSQWLYFQETETEDAGNLESGISGATSIVDAAWANNLLSELFSTASE